MVPHHKPSDSGDAQVLAMMQIILFYKVGCHHCHLWMDALKHIYHLTSSGVVFRVIWVRSLDPLVERYKEELKTTGTPLLVMETDVETKILSQGMIGVTSEGFANGFMESLRDHIAGRRARVDTHI